MIVTEIKYLEFTGTPRNPLTNSQFTINQRNGLIIKIKTNLNEVGFGEASPLQGLSKENYEDVLNAVKDLKMFLGKNTEMPINEILSKVNELPSLKFAIESAVNRIELISSQHKERTTTIPVNEIIGISSLDETLNYILAAEKIAITTIKLKIGRPNFNDDFSIINSINDRYPNIKLRLDVNSIWNYEESLKYFERLRKFNIEYIEQPVGDLKTLFKLAEVSPLQIAPDEALHNLDDVVSAIENPKINFIIIKPSLYGFNDVINLIQYANDKGVRIIISSLFESAVGKLSNIYLAALCNHNSAHGLMPEVVSNEIESIARMEIQNGNLRIEKYRNFKDFEFKKEFV